MPPFDNVHSRGCLDLEQYVSQAVPTRPNNWIDRGRHVVGPAWSTARPARSGDPAQYQDDLDVKFAIAPIYGESGFPSVCGERVAPTAARRRPPERTDRMMTAVGTATMAAEAVAADGGGRRRRRRRRRRVTPRRAARIGPCRPRS